MSCCVPGCDKYTGMCNKFARIPKDPCFRNIWLQNIKNPFLFGLDSKKLNNYRVCIRHFEKEYINHDSSKNKNLLKKGAIPTLSLNEGVLNAELDFKKLYEEYKSVPNAIHGETGMETDEPASDSCTRDISFVPGSSARDMSPVPGPLVDVAISDGLYNIKMDKSRMKEKFYEHINRRPQKANSSQMSATKYFKLMDEVKAAKSGINKENRHYWLLKHYDVITINMEEKLIVPIVNGQVLYYVVLEELFDILYETHASIRHGGRDRMKNVLQQQYKNITIQDINTFLNLCESCVQKRMCEKGLVAKPMIFLDFNARCQVDLIDFQSRADGEFKFIMIYQDYLTKFVILRALKSEQAVEVAEQLLNIFLLFGAPSILQSENGSEFVNNIIEDLKKMWPELRIIHGKPQHNQSQGSVECIRQDIENMLNTWMQQNQCDNWSKGLGFVQFTRNKALHAGNTRSPFQAMFGQPAKIGLTSSSLPRNVIQDINTEEDLEKVLQESVIQQDSLKTSKLQVDNIPENNMTENVLFEQVWVEGKLLKDEVLEDVDTIEGEKENEVVELEKFCKICEATINSFRNTDVCELCSLQLKIKNSSEEAKEHLEIQAKRMKIISDASHPQTEICMPVPDVDRDRGDLRSIWTRHKRKK